MGICRGLTLLFGLAWLLALAMLAVGTFGLFGQERDPLAGVFLVPLGLPWNRALDGLDGSARAVAAALAPGVNLAILAAVCRWRRRRR